MATTLESLEERLATLEAEFAELRREKTMAKAPYPKTAPELFLLPYSPDWAKNIMGRFANDPDYDEAMRLGREYRESLRPPNA